MVEIPEEVWTRSLEIEQSYEEVHKGKTEASVMTIEEEEVMWYYDIMKFLELKEYLDGANKRERRFIRIMAIQYILWGGQLCRRSYDGIHLHFLKKEEAKKVMEEVQQGICGRHMNGRMLAKKILRIGYYWNMMETDCVDYVKSCHDCQTYTNLNHASPSELYSMTSPWPFSICGSILRKKCHMSVRGASKIIFDNGSHFEAEVQRIMEEYSIEHYQSSPYRP